VRYAHLKGIFIGFVFGAEKRHLSIFDRNFCLYLVSAPHPIMFRPAPSNDLRQLPQWILQLNSKNSWRYGSSNFAIFEKGFLGQFSGMTKFELSYLHEFLKLSWSIHWKLSGVITWCGASWRGYPPGTDRNFCQICSNGNFRPNTQSPQMCRLGAHTAPQNLAPKYFL